jgi:hypothetical protein
MRATKQVIVSDKGHSWLGFYTSNKIFHNSLSDILLISKQKEYQSGKWINAFWVLDMDGHCVAAQPHLTEAMKYYGYDEHNRILVHFQKGFVY